LFFIIVSTICTIFWWRGVLPFPFLGGDASNQASLAASLVYTDAFARDALFSDPTIFGAHISTLHIHMVKALGAIFGDFGTGYLSILAPGTFLQLLAFYFLGKYLTKSQYAGIALALISIGKIELTYDYWGIITDFHPRILYQAILPFIILSFMIFGPTPRKWPLLMAAHGLLVYVHPPSAPPVALAMLLALIVYRTSDQSLGYLIQQALIAGLSFLLVCAPFVYNFITVRDLGDPASYRSVVEAFAGSWDSVYLDSFGFFGAMFEHWVPRYVLVGWALFGSFVLIINEKHRHSDFLFIVTSMFLIGAISTLLPWLEQIISQRLDRPPALSQMVRAIRIIAPFMLILSVWGTYSFLNRAIQCRCEILIIVIAALWLSINRPGSIPFQDTLACISSGQILCPTQRMNDELPVLIMFRDEVPRGTTILPVVSWVHEIDFVMALRYFSYQSVVHSAYDRTMFNAYKMMGRLAGWKSVTGELNSIYNAPTGRQKMIRVFNLAKKLDAEMIVLDFPVSVGDIEIVGSLHRRLGSFTIINRAK
jgi:hypothetical protein